MILNTNMNVIITAEIMQNIHQDNITNASKKVKYKENKKAINAKINKYLVNFLSIEALFFLVEFTYL